MGSRWHRAWSFSEGSQVTRSYCMGTTTRIKHQYLTTSACSNHISKVIQIAQASSQSRTVRLSTRPHYQWAQVFKRSQVVRKYHKWPTIIWKSESPCWKAASIMASLRIPIEALTSKGDPSYCVRITNCSQPREPEWLGKLLKEA